MSGTTAKITVNIVTTVYKSYSKLIKKQITGYSG